MKKLSYYYFSLISFSVFPQAIKVVDATTLEPIPYASVYLLNEDKKLNGLSCDDNGNAVLSPFDFSTVKISCIGYEDVVFSKADISTLVYLKPKATELEELIIGNNTEVFTYKGKKGRYLGMLKDTEDILYFRNKYKHPLGLKLFSMKIKKAIIENKIRLLMYKVTDSTKHYRPGENLLQQDILFTIKPGTEGLVEIDLTDYNIQLPAEGAYIGIEVVDCYDSYGNCSLDKQHMNEFETIESYEHIFIINRRYTSNGWTNTNALWQQSLEEKQKKPKRKNRKYFVIPAFSIEVYTD